MKMEHYESALVIGLGASGEWAARLLLSEGVRVVAVDASDSPGLRQAASGLRAAGGLIHLGCRGLPEERFSVAVVSPGVPETSPWVQGLEGRGIRVVSELELAWSRCRGRVGAVTGSNGKSTAAKLWRDTLARAGLRVALGGNYGPPFARLVLEEREADWYVVEVSSFQLERVRDFRPDIGMLLNVHPNHLDRHGTLERYAQLKSRLFAQMGERDVAVVQDELAAGPRRIDMGAGRRITFGLSAQADYRYSPGRIEWGAGAGKRGLDASGAGGISIASSAFDNRILGPTAAAVTAAAVECGCKVGCVAEAARDFVPLPHRMQSAGTVCGVEFIDNSKATNLAALAASLAMVDRPVRLIAGGLLKETDLQSPKELLVKKVRGAYLIGKAAESMAVAWGSLIPCHACSDIKDAVQRAFASAERGEIILLAPGCASFDQFGGFEDRGNRFLEIVSSLGNMKERGAK